MNLFRSEEHVRRWALYDPAAAEGVIPLPDLAAVFGTEGRRHLLDGDYIARWLPRRGAERIEALKRIGRTSSFWLGGG